MFLSYVLLFFALGSCWGGATLAMGRTKIDTNNKGCWENNKGCWEKVKKNDRSTNTKAKPVICLHSKGKMAASQACGTGQGRCMNIGIWHMYTRAGKLEILSWGASKDQVFSEHFTSCFYKFEGHELALSGCELDGYWQRSKEDAF